MSEAERVGEPSRRRGYRTIALLFAAGLAVGYGVGHLSERYDVEARLGVVTAGDVAAMVIALGLIVSGLGGIAASRSPRIARMMIDPLAAGGATPSQVLLVRVQGVGLLAAGVGVGAPLVGATLGPTGQVAAYGLCVAIVAAQGWFNLALWRRCDEYMRRTMIEAVAITFFIGSSGLFLWAAAERIGLVPPLTAWDAFVWIMASYLVTSSAVSFRRLTVS